MRRRKYSIRCFLVMHPNKEKFSSCHWSNPPPILRNTSVEFVSHDFKQMIIFMTLKNLSLNDRQLSSNQSIIKSNLTLCSLSLFSMMRECFIAMRHEISHFHQFSSFLRSKILSSDHSHYLAMRGKEKQAREGRDEKRIRKEKWTLPHWIIGSLFFRSSFVFSRSRLWFNDRSDDHWTTQKQKETKTKGTTTTTLTYTNACFRHWSICL